MLKLLAVLKIPTSGTTDHVSKLNFPLKEVASDPCKKMLRDFFP